MNTGNMTLVYGAVAVLSVMLLIGYLLFEKKKEENVVFLVVHPEHIPRIFSKYG